MFAPLLRFSQRRMARAFETGRILPYLILAIATTALASAAVMRFTDSSEYPNFGRALWWSVQTVTTVGYGDVTPTSPWGRFVASLLMILGFAFLSIITGTVASLLVAQQTGSRDLERRIEALEEEVKKRPQ
jgi:voltage-gated potassium channel